jgi:hypothetical protein
MVAMSKPGRSAILARDRTGPVDLEAVLSNILER